MTKPTNLDGQSQNEIQNQSHDDEITQNSENEFDLFQECLIQVVNQLEKFDKALKQAQKDLEQDEVKDSKKPKKGNEEDESQLSPQDLHVRKTRHKDYSMTASTTPAKVGMKRRRQVTSLDKVTDVIAPPVPAHQESKQQEALTGAASSTGKRRGRKRKSATDSVQRKDSIPGQSKPPDNLAVGAAQVQIAQKSEDISQSPSKLMGKPIQPLEGGDALGGAGVKSKDQSLSAPRSPSQQPVKVAPRGKGFRLRNSQGQLASSWGLQEAAQKKVSSGEQSPSASPGTSFQRPAQQHPPLKLMTGSTPIAIGLTNFVLEALKEGPRTFKELCHTVTYKFEKDIDYFVRYNEKEKKAHANADIATVCAVLRSLGVIKDQRTPLLRPIRENPYMPQLSSKLPDLFTQAPGSTAVPKSLSDHVADVLQFLKNRTEEQRKVARLHQQHQLQHQIQLQRQQQQQQQQQRRQQWLSSEASKQSTHRPNPGLASPITGKDSSTSPKLQKEKFVQQQPHPSKPQNSNQAPLPPSTTGLNSPAPVESPVTKSLGQSPFITPALSPSLSQPPGKKHQPQPNSPKLESISSPPQAPSGSMKKEDAEKSQDPDKHAEKASLVEGDKLQARTPAKAQGQGQQQHRPQANPGQAEGQGQGPGQAGGPGEGQGQGQIQGQQNQHSAIDGSAPNTLPSPQAQAKTTSHQLALGGSTSSHTEPFPVTALERSEGKPAANSTTSSLDSQGQRQNLPHSQPKSPTATKSLLHPPTSQTQRNTQPEGSLLSQPKTNHLSRSLSEAHPQHAAQHKYEYTHQLHRKPSSPPQNTQQTQAPSSASSPSHEHKTTSQSKPLQHQSCQSQQQGQMKIHPSLQSQNFQQNQSLNPSSPGRQQVLQHQPQLHSQQLDQSKQIQHYKKQSKNPSQHSNKPPLNVQQKVPSQPSSLSQPPTLSSPASTPSTTKPQLHPTQSHFPSHPQPKNMPPFPMQKKMHPQVSASRPGPLHPGKQKAPWPGSQSQVPPHTTQTTSQKSFPSKLNSFQSQTHSPNQSKAPSQAHSQPLSTFNRAHPSRSRPGTSQSNMSYRSSSGQPPRPQMHKFATAREMQAQKSVPPATVRELQAHQQQKAQLQAQVQAQSAQLGIPSTGTGPGRPDSGSGRSPQSNKKVSHSQAFPHRRHPSQRLPSPSSSSKGIPPQGKPLHQNGMPSKAEEIDDVNGELLKKNNKVKQLTRKYEDQRRQVLQYAEFGELGLIREKSVHMYEMAVHWLTEMSDSFFFQPLAFDLAVNGHFTELERRYGPSIALMMMVWVSNQSSEWSQLKKKRETIVKVSHPYSLGFYDAEAELYFNTTFQIDPTQDIVCGMLPTKIAEASHAALRRANMLLREERLLQDLCKRNGVSLQNLLDEVTQEPLPPDDVPDAETSPWGRAPAGLENEDKLPQAVVVPLPPLVEMTAEQLARKVNHKDLSMRWQIDPPSPKKDFFKIPAMFTPDDLSQEMDLLPSTESNSALEQEILGMDLSLDLNSSPPSLPSATMSYNSNSNNVFGGVHSNSDAGAGSQSIGKKGRGRGKRQAVANSQRLQMYQIQVDKSLKCNFNQYGICTEPIPWSDVASQFQVLAETKDQTKDVVSIADHGTTKIVDLLKNGDREIIAPAVTELQLGLPNDLGSGDEDTDDELYLKRHETALHKMRQKMDKIMSDPAASFRRRV